jgi:AraC family transcriptional regulator
VTGGRAGRGSEYDKRVNAVIDHIRAHLADDLTLDGLARVAAFSPFHFHRLFTAITGETPFAFIQRVRVERAAVALSGHRDQSVLAVALDHGFSSAAAFARAFRARFGMSATEWRQGGAERWRARQARALPPPRRKHGEANRKRGKAAERVRADTPRKRKEVSMNVRVTTLPAYHVAYMRYTGPYGAHGIPDLWTKFHEWMQTRDLAPDGRITLGVAYDDPDVTAPDRCRYDACVVVPADFTPDRWVNVTAIAGGKSAVSGFVGTAHEIRAAWDTLYRTWLPGSGYEPDDRPCFELYRGNPTVDGKPGAFRCDLCLPIRPL